MNPSRGLAWGCALVLCGTAAGLVRAEDDPVFRECCDRCGPAVAAYPPCTSCYPTTTYYAPRCGPIRRLLGLCRPVPVASYRPAYSVAPVASCAPPCSSCSPGVLPADPVPLPAPPPGPTVVPNNVSPVPVPPGVEGAPRNLSPVPETPSPPLSGSSYRPQRPIAPVPAQRLTPPLAPAPVRLDHFVSDPDGQSRGPVEAVPATMTRTPASR